MNRKQFRLIVFFGLIIGAFGFYFYKREAASWRSTGQQLGQKIFSDFPLNGISHILIKTDENEVNLIKSDDIWKLKERWDYPANFSQISDFLKKVWELKSIQTVKVGPSQFERLELVAPTGEKKSDSKASKTGVKIEFKDKNNQLLKSLLLGKKHVRENKSPSPSPYSREETIPNGRYILSSDSKDVILISDPLSDVVPNISEWLDKAFVRIEKLQSVSVLDSKGSTLWTINRQTEDEEMKLVNAKGGEKLDPSKLSGLTSVLSGATFIDIASPQILATETGLDKPTIVHVKTFDGFVYDLKIGKSTSEDKTNAEANHYIKVSVAATLQKDRVADEGEKPEDKAKLDKEFKENVQKLEQKLKQEQTFANWTYLAPNWVVDVFLKGKKNLLIDKNSPTAGKPKAPPARPPKLQRPPRAAVK